MVKMCADYHCEENGGETRKYRALMWRDVGEERSQRRTLSFEVLSDPEHHESESEGVKVEALRKQVDAWQSVCEEMRKMTAMAIEFGNRSVDRVLEQARVDSERVKPLTELTREMLAHYREGLRMQASAVKEVGEMRVQQQIAQSGGKDDKFWEVLGPAVQLAVTQAQQRLLGGKPVAKALPSAGGGGEGATGAVVPIERKEHRPPAESSGGVAAGAGAGAPEIPESIVGLSHMVLDNLGAQTLLRMSRVMDDEQVGHLESLSSATDDDSAARAIVGLMQSLTADAAGLVKIQGLLTAPQITVFRQLGELATRHLDAGSSGTAASEGSSESTK